jgi:hypothetical protein
MTCDAFSGLPAKLRPTDEFLLPQAIWHGFGSRRR